MAGKRLVGKRVRERMGARWQIRIELDARAQLAVVPVVSRPRLIGDQAERQRLAGRDRKYCGTHLANLADEPIEDGPDTIDGDGQPFVTSLPPFAEAARPG